SGSQDECHGAGGSSLAETRFQPSTSRRPASAASEDARGGWKKALLLGRVAPGDGGRCGSVFISRSRSWVLRMPMTTTPSGLQFEDTQPGTGASPAKGQTCVMHYTGWLWENGAKGAKFDSSVDRKEPFSFPIGTGRVIKGWDEGVAAMK